MNHGTAPDSNKSPGKAHRSGASRGMDWDPLWMDPRRQQWHDEQVRVRKQGAQRFRARMVWGAAIVLGSAVITIFVASRFKQGARPPVESGGVSAAAVVMTAEGGMPYDRPDWIGPRPDQVVERFLKAPDYRGRIRWVRDPGKVGGALLEFFNTGPGASEVCEGWKKVGDETVDGRLVERFEVRLLGGGVRRMDVVIDGRRALIDFASYAR
jgi:hypothetical protein